jgi:hypothetical protein
MPPIARMMMSRVKTMWSGSARAQGGQLHDHDEEAMAVPELEEAGVRGSDHRRHRRKQGTVGAERVVARKSKDLGRNLYGQPDYILPKNINNGSQLEPFLTNRVRVIITNGSQLEPLLIV